MKDYSQHTAKEYLDDEEFILAYYTRELDSFRQSVEEMYPQQKMVLDEACQLINGIKITRHKVSIQDIAENTRRLEKSMAREKQLSRRRKLRHMYITASAVAAVIAICFVLAKDILLYSIQDNFREYQYVFDATPDSTLRQKDIQLYIDETLIRTLGADAHVTCKDEELSEKISDKQQNKLIVPFGRRARLTLNDNSTMWINSGTTVVYPSKFASGSREIYVDGEVYIEVTKDTKRPFIIKTSDIDVKVLGTSFNLSAYRSDTEKSVVLAEGKVEVNDRNNSSSVLYPNHRYTLRDGLTVVDKVNAHDYTSWKDGLLFVSDMNLSYILKKVSRYYNVDIKYNQDIVMSCSGKLIFTEDIEDIMTSISESAPIEWERNGDIITVKPKRSKI